jgi:hypothetical protein
MIRYVAQCDNCLVQEDLVKSVVPAHWVNVTIGKVCRNYCDTKCMCLDAANLAKALADEKPTLSEVYEAACTKISKSMGGFIK